MGHSDPTVSAIQHNVFELFFEPVSSCVGAEIVGAILRALLGGARLTPRRPERLG
jgi:hypothetical protein